MDSDDTSNHISAVSPVCRQMSMLLYNWRIFLPREEMENTFTN